MKIYVSCDIEGLAGIATFDMERRHRFIPRIISPTCGLVD